MEETRGQNAGTSHQPNTNHIGKNYNDNSTSDESERGNTMNGNSTIGSHPSNNNNSLLMSQSTNNNSGGGVPRFQSVTNHQNLVNPNAIQHHQQQLVDLQPTTNSGRITMSSSANNSNTIRMGTNMPNMMSMGSDSCGVIFGRGDNRHQEVVGNDIVDRQQQQQQQQQLHRQALMRSMGATTTASTNIHPYGFYSNYQGTGSAVDTMQRCNEPRCICADHKRKRRERTSFTKSQLNVLMETYTVQPYPDVQQRLEIASRIGLDESRVQVWFKNRRAKERKEELTNNLNSGRQFSRSVQLSSKPLNNQQQQQRVGPSNVNGSHYNNISHSHHHHHQQLQNQQQQQYQQQHQQPQQHQQDGGGYRHANSNNYQLSMLIGADRDQEQHELQTIAQQHQNQYASNNLGYSQRFPPANIQLSSTTPFSELFGMSAFADDGKNAPSLGDRSRGILYNPAEDVNSLHYGSGSEMMQNGHIGRQHLDGSSGGSIISSASSLPAAKTELQQSEMPVTTSSAAAAAGMPKLQPLKTTFNNDPQQQQNPNQG